MNSATEFLKIRKTGCLRQEASRWLASCQESRRRPMVSLSASSFIATPILPPLKWEARDGRMNLDKFKMDSWFKSHNTPGKFTFRYGKDAEIAAKIKRSSNCKAVREVSFDEFEENPFKAPAAYIDMRKSFKDSLNDSKIKSTSLSRCSSSSQFKAPSSKRRHLGFYPTKDI